MRKNNYAEWMIRVTRFIESGNSGSPAEFAARMKMSQSHFYRCLRMLRQSGSDVRFSRTLQTYYQERENDNT